MKVYTDGCCNNNGSGWAVVCPELMSIIRGDIPGATNQQAELSAIVQAVHWLGPNIEIFTDSTYVIGCYTKWYQRWLTNGWVNSRGRPVENQQLISVGLSKNAHTARYTHVKGHSGDVYNDMADYYTKHLQLSPNHPGWNLM